MILFLMTQAFAADISVTPSDDIAAAIQVLQPGDTMLLTAGTYTVNGWNWALLGEEGKPITIRGEDGAILEISPNEEGSYPNEGIYLHDSTHVVLDNFEITGDSGWETSEKNFTGISVNTVSDLTISNVTVSRTPNSSLYIRGESLRVAVTDSEFSDTLDASGVYIGCGSAGCFSQDFAIERNLIHDIGGESRQGLIVQDGTQNTTIRDNVVYGVEGDGIWIGSPANGEANTVEANVVWNVGGSGMVGRGPVTLRNNIIFSTASYGLYFSNPGYDFEGIHISFNTIVDTEDWGVQLRDWADISGNVFANNAVCNPIGDSVDIVESSENENPADNHLISNNLLCGKVENLSETEGHFLIGHGFHDFTDVEGWNFYPSPSSLLIDAGNPSGDTFIPDTDFNGVERDGGAPDIGAYEWDRTDNPGWQIQEGFKDLDISDDVSDDFVSEGCCGSNESPEKALLLAPLLMLGAVRRRRR